MTFALVSLLATLSLVLALNWNRFAALGWGNVARMLLIWGAIITRWCWCCVFLDTDCSLHNIDYRIICYRQGGSLSLPVHSRPALR